MGDRSVGLGGYWRGFVAKVLAERAATVLIDGLLFHGAISPIEHVWRTGLRNRLFTRP